MERGGRKDKGKYALVRESGALNLAVFSREIANLACRRSLGVAGFASTKGIEVTKRSATVTVLGDRVHVDVVDFRSVSYDTSHNRTERPGNEVRVHLRNGPPSAGKPDMLT